MWQNKIAAKWSSLWKYKDFKEVEKNGIWVEVDKLVCAELEFEIWLIARAEPTLWLLHYTEFSLLPSFVVSEAPKFLGFDMYQV